MRSTSLFAVAFLTILSACTVSTEPADEADVDVEVEEATIEPTGQGTEQLIREAR